MIRSLSAALLLAACSSADIIATENTSAANPAAGLVPEHGVAIEQLATPSVVRRFSGWTVRCDGQRRCQAATRTEPGPAGSYDLLFERGADSPNFLDLRVRALNRAPSGVTLVIDGDVFAARWMGGGVATDSLLATEVARLATGRRLSVYDAVSGCEGICPPGVVVRYFVPRTATKPSPAPLVGARAALRFMDRQLRFAGTPHAIVDERGTNGVP